MWRSEVERERERLSHPGIETGIPTGASAASEQPTRPAACSLRPLPSPEEERHEERRVNEYYVEIIQVLLLATPQQPLQEYYQPTTLDGGACVRRGRDDDFPTGTG